MSLATAKVLYVFLDTPSLRRKRRLLEGGLGLPVIENERHGPHHQHGIVKYDAGDVILSLNHTSRRRFAGGGSDGVRLVFTVGTDRPGPALAAHLPAGTGELTDPDRHEYLLQPGGGDGGTPSLTELRLSVDRLADAVAFYRDALGLRVGEQSADGAVLTAGPGVRLVLRERPGFRPRNPPGLLIVFHTPDVRATYQDLQRHGLSFRSQVRFEEIGGTARFADPDGHRLCLYEPSPACLRWGSGPKVRAIVGEPVHAPTAEVSPG